LEQVTDSKATGICCNPFTQRTILVICAKEWLVCAGILPLIHVPGLFEALLILICEPQLHCTMKRSQYNIVAEYLYINVSFLKFFFKINVTH